MPGGNRSGNEHHEPLSALGIPEPQTAALAEYLRLVAVWNARTNLTAAKTAEERTRVLVADAWLAAPEVGSGALIDVGSGNGSPGLVLALLHPNVSVTLLEPRTKRWAFLRDAARALGRPDITVERVRCEDFQPNTPAETVTIRAVGVPLTAVAHLVKPDGRVLVFGGNPVAESPFTLLRNRPLDRSDLHVFGRSSSDVSRET